MRWAARPPHERVSRINLIYNIVPSAWGFFGHALGSATLGMAMGLSFIFLVQLTYSLKLHLHLFTLAV